MSEQEPLALPEPTPPLVSKYTEEQAFQQIRKNMIIQKTRRVKHEFDTNPSHTYWNEHQDGNKVFFEKQIALNLLQNADRSLDRAMRDAGMENEEWKEDWQELMTKEYPPDPKVEGSSFCPEHGLMKPVFREKKAGVLYWKCANCTPPRIYHPGEL